DVAILKGLLKDGRKSFRQISRETGISTPTVKARFDRLVNIGFIKSVSPILDFEKVDYGDNLVIDNMLLQATKNKREQLKNSIKKGIGIQLKCDFCRVPISGTTHVFKFANFERFFCCTECRSAYKKKYHGRTEAIVEGHANNNMKN
nr:winged helix-turn-helix transcriptional regulator [Thermoproteota archaeon]